MMRITENKKKETEKEMRKKTEQMKRVIENRKREKEEENEDRTHDAANNVPSK